MRDQTEWFEVGESRKRIIHLVGRFEAWREPTSVAAGLEDSTRPTNNLICIHGEPVDVLARRIGLRAFPAQIAVHLICGVALSPVGRSYKTMRERMIAGLEMLRSISGQDFGFELQKWHDDLKVSTGGGYTWNRSIALPKVMKQALINPQWLATVAAIEG